MSTLLSTRLSRRARAAGLLILAGLVLPLFSCGGSDTASEAATEGPQTLPASMPAPEVEDGVLLVSPERVREWQTTGEPFALVDARDAVQFSQEHLPGAINIPYVDIRPGARLPARNSRIVVYCSDAECPISRFAHDALTRLGYNEVYDMRQGLQGWKDAGYPTVVGDENGEPEPDEA